ncbi:hypothetical protein OJ997_23345 [Solirubrobacter phytolaccae]|uniref:Lipoprotein n=1 Tax=Solirubrobacter phytolaccae TaxID=1404360 RepID=A0A9X3NFT7_9ACTN|nr:hypothetical protein [Solirubrobacter phytolaccae]MDA0183266.1 hypothetical protein [Solirubrobacter phytolaccae]
MTRLWPLLIVALLVAGCGSTPETETTAGGTTATPTQAKASTFSACMREHGIKDFPDPDASGELTVENVVNEAKIDTDTPAFKQALRACKDLQPAGYAGRGKRTPKEQDGALQFAECIREHGVKDFPDPVNGEPLVNTYKIPSSNTEAGMAALNAAMAACGKYGPKP